MLDSLGKRSGSVSLHINSWQLSSSWRTDWQHFLYDLDGGWSPRRETDQSGCRFFFCMYEQRSGLGGGPLGYMMGWTRVGGFLMDGARVCGFLTVGTLNGEFLIGFTGIGGVLFGGTWICGFITNASSLGVFLIGNWIAWGLIGGNWVGEFFNGGTLLSEFLTGDRFKVGFNCGVIMGTSVLSWGIIVTKVFFLGSETKLFGFGMFTLVVLTLETKVFCFWPWLCVFCIIWGRPECPLGWDLSSSILSCMESVEHLKKIYFYYWESMNENI